MHTFAIVSCTLSHFTTGYSDIRVFIGLSMGMVTHHGSWVWVPMGMGMGCDLDTHVPMTMGLIPMVPSMAMINISCGGGVNRYLLMLVTTIELLWGWLGMILMLVTTIELLWGWLRMIVVVRGNGGILITDHEQWWV